MHLQQFFSIFEIPEKHTHTQRNIFISFFLNFIHDIKTDFITKFIYNYFTSNSKFMEKIPKEYKTLINS